MEASWDSKIHGNHRIRGAVAEVQGPLLRILQDFPVCISLVYIQRKRKVRKDYEQEKNMSRLVRVSDSVRHAQAQGLARRIQSAAKLRVRHRA